jgi:hypothetical protein
VDNAVTLPEAIQELLKERVRTIDELEAMLLLRADPESLWDDERLAAALQVSPALAHAVLDELERAGICVREAPNAHRMRFTLNAELARQLAELAIFYEQHRVDVLRFISNTAISRVRTDALRTFAHAFREKKDR